MKPRTAESLFIVMISIASISAASETIISKQDVDHIFSMTKPEWEAYAQSVQYPATWEVALSRHDTGVGLMAFDRSTRYGLSVQPLYHDDKSPPDMLVVGSYYPDGTFPEFTEKLKKEIEEAAKQELGPRYSATAMYVKLPPFEGVELTVFMVAK